MNILIVGAVFAVLLLFAPRFLGRSRRAMLDQYEILEKRLRLQRKTFPSKWGKGIGERYTLAGEFHGYPLTLYDHFRGSGKEKVTWTSLALEMLFAGEWEICLESAGGDSVARFPHGETLEEIDCGLPGFTVLSNSEALTKLLFDRETCDRVSRFSGPGAFRLSKGFFEYRESGLMTDGEMRIRFQEALRLLADLGDRIAELSGQSE